MEEAESSTKGNFLSSSMSQNNMERLKNLLELENLKRINKKLHKFRNISIVNLENDYHSTL